MEVLTLVKLKFSVNPELIDKIQPSDKRFMAEGFISVDGTIEDLAQAVQDGWGFSYQFIDQKRRTENFLATDILMVDMDGTRTLSETLEDQIVKDYCSLYYTTPSHNPDCHRFRLVFVLPKTITDPKEVKAASFALAKRLSGDLAATDAARIFYGNRNCQLEILGKEISNDFLSTLIAEGTNIPISDSIISGEPVATRSTLRLKPTDFIRQADGSTNQLQNILNKTSVYCPFHHDLSPSAFIARTSKGSTYLYCSACATTYWADQKPEYVFNSFEKTVKAHLKDPIKVPAQNLTLLDLLNDDEQIGQIDHVKVTQDQFIKLDTIPNGLTFIKSPKGSGKTTFLKRAVEKLIYTFGSPSLETYEEGNDPESESSFYTDKKVLLIGHRQALIREMCQNLGLSCYLDYPAKKGAIRQSRYGVCLDSLWMALDPTESQKTKFDLIIIDECEQVLSHFLSETIGNKRVELFQQFQTLLVNAKNIVALDADLGWITFKTLTSLTAHSKNKLSVHIHINEWQPTENSYFLYPSKNQIIQHIKLSILDGKRIFITCNSKGKVKTLEAAIKELEKKINKEISVYSITSDNSRNTESQEFIKDIKTEILNYQVILASPSLGTGVDITFENAEQKIDVVYGIFENRVNSHMEIDQQLARVRHPKEVHVWISPQQFDFETEFGVIKAETLEKNLIHKMYAHLAKTEPDNPEYSGGEVFINMAAMITAQNRASKNQLRKNFIEYRLEQGWKPIYVLPNDQLIKEGKQFFKAGNIIREQQEIDAILNAGAVDEETYLDIEERLSDNQGLVTRPEFYSYIRTKIELFYQEPITQELVKLDDKGRFRRQIQIFSLITAPQRISSINANKLKTPLTKLEKVKEQIIKNRDSECLLIYGLLSKTPIFKGGVFFPITYQSEDLTEFSQNVKKTKSVIEGQLDIAVPRDIESKPAQFLGKLLKLVGLEHWVTGSNLVNGKKIRHYRISPQKLQQIQNIVERRNALLPWDASGYISEWKFVNQLHNFKDKNKELEEFFKH